MILVDVNVLIYAFRRDIDRHPEYRTWLKKLLTNEPVFGVSELVLSSLVRIVTHPKVFARPSTLDEAFGFVDSYSITAQLRYSRTWQPSLVNLSRYVPASKSEWKPRYRCLSGCSGY